ncbi:calcium-binding protein [Microcoleus sp. AR_TQ3_B6]|uniref:calcium-binding protein n=1 Tax=Microcoleus sp. AR_TQ3_B6 TaxID=3055284 RepID=UPI002FD4C267
MALQRDPSGSSRLFGDNTSEYTDLRFGSLGNSSGEVLLLGGDDTVDGSIASDSIFGNEGEDLINGGFGNDSLFGGKGKDAMAGDEGNDYLSGGQDADALLGNAGNDILLGGRGNDLLFSGNGFDTLVGGLGRDLLGGFNDNNSAIKFSGSNLYVLQPEAGVSDVNQADFIRGFRVGFDRIGLADGLTANDIVLESLTNVSITIQVEVSQAVAFIATPDLLRPVSILTSGTLIKVRNSGNAVGFVADVTPSQIQGSITSVQGF